MKIAILSPGRFHVCDLARELSALGHEVYFYSYVPRARTHKFGLPNASAKPVLVWVAIPLFISRLLKKTPLSNWANNFLKDWMDFVVSRFMKPCDVVIAMSGCFNRSVALARKKWRAKILIERGSRHILSQKKILDDLLLINPKTKTVSKEDVRRELKDYQLADRIVVPSKHVMQSFVEYGVPEERLFRNPYGVDLSMFGPTQTPLGKPTVLMTGTWSLQKGCDLLINALHDTDYLLIHAGSKGDCSFPTVNWFKTLGVLDQSTLLNVYAQAHIFVLPSRQEGLALVQAQALTCGLPLVCSDRTGGEDLREMLDDKNMVTVVKSGDVVALKKGIVKAMNYALSRQGLRQISDVSREQMSWKAYGERYNRFLTSLICGPNS